MNTDIFNHALIMAAGRGMRMRPLTDTIPKALAPTKESTLIGERIESLKSKFNNVHITVGYKGSMLASYVIEKEVSSVFNTEGQGNSWWIFNTLMRFVDQPVLVLTCDNVATINFSNLFEDYKDKGSPPCMVVPVKPIKRLDGDYIFEEGGLVKELSREKKSDYYCSGIQILNPMRINSLIKVCDDFNQVWSQLITIEALYSSSVVPKSWYAVDDLVQLNYLNNKS